MAKNLAEKFQDAQVEPSVKYSGYAGYEKALADIKSELLSAYPEYQGRVEILDLKALEENRDAELKRLSDALGVDDIEEVVKDQLHGGRCFKGVNAQGQSIAVAAGWDAHNYPEEDLNNQVVIGLADVVVHELGHAIDVLDGIIEEDHVHMGNDDGAHGNNVGNFTEGYADSFRVAMAVLNGHPEENIKQLISSYEKDQLVGVMHKYSNSDMLNAAYYDAVAQRDALDAAGETSQGGFQYWHQAKAIADQVRAENLYKHENDIQSSGRLTSYSERVTQRVISWEVSRFINEAIAQERPDLLQEGQEGELKKFKNDVRKGASNITLQNQEGTEQEMQVSGLAYRAREHMYDLMKERDFIPFANRYTSVDDYNMGIGTLGLNGEEKAYPFTKMLGEAVLKHQETGASFDENLVMGYSMVVSKTKEFSELPLEGMSRVKLAEYLESNTEAAQLLADGYSLEIALKDVIDKQAAPMLDGQQIEGLKVTAAGQ